MNVLFCTTIFDHAITGAGRFAQCVAQLHNQDPTVRVHVLSEETQQLVTPDSKAFPVALSAGSKRRWLSYYFKSRDYAASIQRLVSQERIDVIFMNDAWLAYHWLKDHYEIPVIVFVHDDNAMHVLQNAIGAVPAMLLRRKLERASVQMASEVVTNSEYMRRKLSTYYQITSERISLLPLAFVDYTHIPFGYQQIDISKSIHILFIKNDIRRGGLGLLAQTLATMRQFQFVLTVIGPDISEIKASFGPALNDNGNIRWNLIGPVEDHDQVLALMRQHHIFCVPASREAFGIAYLEALVSGLRVVYHSTGGIPKALHEFGYAIPERNISGLQNSLLEAIEMEPAMTEQRIRAGREWVEKNYSLDFMIRKLISILQRVTASTSNPNFLTSSI